MNDFEKKHPEDTLRQRTYPNAEAEIMLVMTNREAGVLFDALGNYVSNFNDEDDDWTFINDVYKKLSSQRRVQKD